MPYVFPTEITWNYYIQIVPEGVDREPKTMLLHFKTLFTWINWIKNKFNN